MRDGASRAWAGDDLGALELFTEALAAIDGRTDLLFEQLTAQPDMAFQLTVLDRVGDAEALLRRAQRLAGRTGNHKSLQGVRFWRAGLYFEHGQWDDALAEAPGRGRRR